MSFKEIAKLREDESIERQKISDLISDYEEIKESEKKKQSEVDKNGIRYVFVSKAQVIQDLQRAKEG